MPGSSVFACEYHFHAISGGFDSILRAMRSPDVLKTAEVFGEAILSLQ